MRKVLTFLGASLSLTVVAAVSAKAQQAPDMFKDVDTSHWAYQAVEDLRAKGIVIGYPDGYFRGKRTLTRYEFAVALDRALKQLPGPTTGPAGPPGETGPAGPAGPQGPPGVTPEELATLRRLADEFRAELAAMGNSIAAINRKLDALGRDVAALRDEINRMPKLYGGAYVGIRSDRYPSFYTDQNGRQQLGSAPGSIRNTPAVVHDFRLGVRANILGGAKLDAEIASNNYKNFEGGDTGLNAGSPYVPASSADTYIHHLEITTPFNGIGRGSQFTIGRFGEQLGHLVLWKPSIDLYLDDPFEDDGMYYIDGARLQTNFGSVSLTAVGGKFDSVTGTNGPAWNSPFAGTMPTGTNLFNGNVKPLAQTPLQGHVVLDEMAAVSAGFGFNLMDRAGHLRLTALAGATNAPAFAVPFTNVLVLGVDGDIKPFERGSVTLDYGKTITGTGRFDTVPGGQRDNQAFNATVGYGSGGLNVQAGYRYIDPLFYAPGYWGRIGNWINPTNVQGPTFRAAYDVTPNIGVNIGGDFFSAARNRIDTGGLGPDDQINRVLVGLRWDVAKSFRLTADWEGVFWHLQGLHSGIPLNAAGTVNPTEHYITLGTGYNLTSNTLLKLSYQIGSWDGHNSVYDGSAGITKANFNVFTGQVSVKF